MPPKRGKKGASKKAAAEPATPAVDAANGTEGDSSKNGDTVEDEAPEPTLRVSKRTAKAEPKVGGKKAKKAKEVDAEEDEDEKSGAKAKEDGPSEDVDGEDDSSPTRKTSLRSKRKETSKKTAEENGANMDPKSNRPKRAAAITNTTSKKQTETKKGTTTKTKTKTKKAVNSKPIKEQYEVESILEMKGKSGKREFLVKWKGYGSEQNTWEPEKNLNCPKILSTFLKKEGKSA